MGDGCFVSNYGPRRLPVTWRRVGLRVSLSPGSGGPSASPGHPEVGALRSPGHPEVGPLAEEWSLLEAYGSILQSNA